MKKAYLFAIMISICITAFYSCKTEKHFITDSQYRTQVETDYTQRPLSKERKTELCAIMNNKNISLAEKEALKFLYAYMPYSDLADYPADFFLNQVRYAFMTRDTFSWGKDIPEEIFRHFVLVYRVNNENLDTARMVFFNELKDRIKNMSLHDAALEVNHWCHEKVSYRPADARTSAPLATVRTSLGRCGEESTFTVTALRSVGIPARQCYTPRWAHTDDNHAWVEVWVDGKWFFLGACEPEPELNKGWFEIPSTRCMMVHSNAFGKYNGSENLTAKTNLFSRINMLPNYTNTKKITIIVNDKNGKPIENAIVKFKLYNYAEYYPIASSSTNSNGEASLITGFGDLLIHASKNNIYNYKKIDVRLHDTLHITLNRTAGNEYTEFLDIVPPKEGTSRQNVSKEDIAKNTYRLAYEDSVRNAYTSTFPTEDFAKTINNKNLTEKQIWHFIKKSEGNYREIANFLNNNSIATKNDKLHLFEFLSSLADKDLRDCEANTLLQFIFEYKQQNYPLDVFLKGILAARISNELLCPYHKFLKNNIKLISPSANDIKQWVLANISIDDGGNYFGCPISPKGVFELRHADSHSRDIFFVAACRSFDIPTYLDNATNQIFTYNNGNWQTISFEEKKNDSPTGTLTLTYNQNSETTPNYWTHYTIAKFENGDFYTFDFENDPRVASFPINLQLDTGYYLLSTGNRYSDGTTLSKLTFFNIENKKTTTLPIELRPLTPRTQKHGAIKLSTKTPWNTTIGESTKNHNLIIAFIDPNREPTRHLINDIEAFKTQFENWNGAMVFLVATDKITKDFNAETLAKHLPKNAIIVEDKNASWQNQILKDCNIYFRDNLPLIFIIDNNGNIIFKTEGYRIGTGELLLKSLQQ